MYKPIICLDFDGVIHQYDTPWGGPTFIPDPPVEGAMKFIKDCVNAGFYVDIFSSRSVSDAGRQAMQEWLVHHFKNYCMGEEDVNKNQFSLLADSVRFPKSKPPALVTLDDRAIQFLGPNFWPDVEDLKAFKPWNKEKKSD